MIYLDANVIIRLVEGCDSVRVPIETRLAAYLGRANTLVTSRLSLLEYRSKPIQLNNKATLTQFGDFFQGIELVIVELTSQVIEKATEYRAKYSLKTPDALHFASAIVSNAAEFWTADKGIVRCQEIPVVIV